MLLSFTIRNYKSFKDEITFSMTAAKKQKDLNYSVFENKINDKTYRSLSSAVIYGPNASGKTNLIGAMEVIKKIVLRGHIRNTNEKSMNQAANLLELIPFTEANQEPVLFKLKFIENNILVEYILEIQIGDFSDYEFDRYIKHEELRINEKTVFSRSHTLEIYIKNVDANYLNNNISQNIDSAYQIANSSLNKDELFLTNGFKTIYAKELVSLITNWFQNKLIVIYRSDTLKIFREFPDVEKDVLIIEKTLSEAAKEFGVHSNALGYIASNENNKRTLNSIITKNNKNMAIPVELFESYGTVRFINEFPLIIYALLNGSTLVIDEFDASIHPMALMNIINIFHNDEININHAQLIFNTHNPIFLNAELFRRDEIKFVERDDNTHISTHYSLADFKTSGENAVRKGADYMTNYFINRYGGIKEVDFEDIIQAIIKEKGEENGEKENKL